MMNIKMKGRRVFPVEPLIEVEPVAGGFDLLYDGIPSESGPFTTEADAWAWSNENAQTRHER